MTSPWFDTPASLRSFINAIEGGGDPSLRRLRLLEARRAERTALTARNARSGRWRDSLERFWRAQEGLQQAYDEMSRTGEEWKRSMTLHDPGCGNPARTPAFSAAGLAAARCADSCAAAAAFRRHLAVVETRRAARAELAAARPGSPGRSCVRELVRATATRLAEVVKRGGHAEFLEAIQAEETALAARNVRPVTQLAAFERFWRAYYMREVVDDESARHIQAGVNELTLLVMPAISRLVAAELLAAREALESSPDEVR